MGATEYVKVNLGAKLTHEFGRWKINGQPATASAAVALAAAFGESELEEVRQRIRDDAVEADEKLTKAREDAVASAARHAERIEQAARDALRKRLDADELAPVTSLGRAFES